MRRVEFELAACDVIACPDHPEKQWLALEVIANHLGSSLQEFTIHLVRCGFPRHLDGPVKDTKWVKSFAEEKSRMGANICIVWREVEDEIFQRHPDHRHATFDYYWAAQRSDTDLLDFFTRTSFGHYPFIRIWTHPGQEIPNLLSRLTNRMVPPDNTSPWPTSCHWLHRMFKLETNIKMKNMDTLDSFRSCYGLRLLNKEEIDEEEVVVMEAMLAFLAKYPRPRMPRKITLPKVLYLTLSSLLESYDVVSKGSPFFKSGPPCKGLGIAQIASPPHPTTTNPPPNRQRGELS